MSSPSSPAPTIHSLTFPTTTPSQSPPPSVQSASVSRQSTARPNIANSTTVGSHSSRHSSTPQAIPPSSTAANTAVGHPGSFPTLSTKPSSFKRAILCRVTSWNFLFIAVIVYVVTLGVAASATSRRTLLGLVSASVGTWFLTVLSKLGDITFALAVNQASDSIAWGQLEENLDKIGAVQRDSPSLLNFLSIHSSTGPFGLIRILLASRGMEPDRRTILRLLNVFRLLFIIGLIPGPGVILMADVNQKDLFFPVEAMDVTAGLGIYDPNLAKIYATESSFQTIPMVQGLLSDTTIVHRVDPISESCRATNSCTSYLISGAYNTVRPLPFTTRSDDAPSFKIYNAPAYQIDMWDPPSNLSFGKTDCSTYGGNFNGSQGLALCNAKSKENELVSGLAWCASGLSANGTCLDPVSMSGSATQANSWATSWSIWRRTSTVTFSRTSFVIQDVQDLGTPSPQVISPTDLFIAYDLMFYKPSPVSNFTRCDLSSERYAVIQNVAAELYAWNDNSTSNLSQGRSTLRNILAIPLFLFTPTIRVKGLDTSTNETQLGLPDENHVTGAYCMRSHRSVPGRWTVIAYGIVGGITLLLAAVAYLVAARWPKPRTTEFPMLDFAALTQGCDRNGTVVTWATDLPRERDYGNGLMLEKVRDLRVGLQDG
ncbi:hypothetical protein BU16DRAFT_558019 [Lophium mytilinum]|uniref:Uncharacterized protein n=1 Tax=Lophium mytilinum TaxID=390894 RepID=A0A6A6R763_9PEZI|nr:hypothetical protein BU16DRAFT_558019 [Lophium mytilinum]